VAEPSKALSERIARALNGLLDHRRVSAALGLIGFFITVLSAFTPKPVAVVIAGVAFVLLPAFYLVIRSLNRAATGLRMRLASYEEKYAFYEVVDRVVTNDLADPTGASARCESQLTARSLRDGLRTIADRDWGQGATNEYQCDPGTVVAEYSEGGERIKIISLGRTYNRGDIIEFRSSRVLRDAFLDSSEWVEFQPQAGARRIALRILFPCDRPPKTVHVEDALGTLNPAAVTNLAGSGGRVLFSHTLERSKPGQRLFVAWEW
jgi:hypothetical protein